MVYVIIKKSSIRNWVVGSVVAGLLLVAIGLLQGARLWMGMPLARATGINSVATEDNKVAFSINIVDQNTQIGSLAAWLADNNVPATLFVSSKWSVNNPSEMASIASNSNVEIGLIGGSKVVERDISRDIQALGEMSNRDIKLYRSHSTFGKSLLNTIGRLGLHVVGGDVTNANTVNSSSTDAAIMVNASSSGSIVSIDVDRGLTTMALVVHGLLNKGLEIVQVGQLVLNDNYILDSSGRQWAI